MIIAGFALCWFGGPAKHEFDLDDSNSEEDASDKASGAVKKSTSSLEEKDDVSTASSDKPKCPASIEVARKHMLKTACKNPKTGKRFPLCGTTTTINKCSIKLISN